MLVGSIVDELLKHLEPSRDDDSLDNTIIWYSTTRSDGYLVVRFNLVSRRIYCAVRYAGFIDGCCFDISNPAWITHFRSLVDAL